MKVLVISLLILILPNSLFATGREKMNVHLDIKAKGNLTAEAEVIVNLTVTNKGKAKIRVLKYEIGAEDDESIEPTNDFFEITRNGEKFPYRGIMAKRVKPEPEDYVTIAPGKSVKGKFDLSHAYDWSDKSAKYTISYRPASESNTVEFSFK